MENSDKKELKRGLQNRHIQLIALGRSNWYRIVFRDRNGPSLAGPSVIFRLCCCWFPLLFYNASIGVKWSLGTCLGSFYFAINIGDLLPVFSSGWNYWLLYILVSMSEFNCNRSLINFWWPEIPLWVSSLFFLLCNYCSQIWLP